MKKYLPVQSERLYERIVEQIETAIVAGELKVGETLPPERELAAQFAVSRTAVREAVKILREKGLIEIHPGRGTFVTNNAPNSMRQSFDSLIKFGPNDGSANLVEVREILEPEIAALAATRMTDEYIADMQDAVDIMDSAPNMDVYVEADLDFHLALAVATENPIIPALMDSIIDLLREQRKRIGLAEGGLARGQHHHKAILDAVKHKDPEAARQAMRRHLIQVAEDSSSSHSTRQREKSD
jgi:GntR family transcriptional repressor for pyruvate dehydrogenase complex